jgi:hypothetical protein
MKSEKWQVTKFFYYNVLTVNMDFKVGQQTVG